MALRGSDAWLVAINAAHPPASGMVLVRRIDWVKESAMLFRLAVSFVHAARSTRRMIVGAITAARMAMTASTAVISINVKAESRAGTPALTLALPLNRPLTPSGSPSEGERVPERPVMGRYVGSAA